MKPQAGCAVAFAMSVSIGHALALTPDQVFERASPGVWSLRALDAAEKPIGFGSAVVIGPGRLITACSVLARAKSIELRRGNQVYPAQLEHPDVARNLCQLNAAGLDSTAVAVASRGAAKVGLRVYLVSVPQRLSTTLGEGLIAGLGSEQAGIPPMQTTLIIGPGSAGGGLFDENARLVGVAMPTPTGRDKPAANVGFAAPADWIVEVPERAAAALALHREQAAAQATGGRNAPASALLPATGTTWKYEYIDRKFSMRIAFTLRVEGVEGWNVHETLLVDGASGPQSATIAARDARFLQRPLSAGRPLFEFAPYLLAAGGGDALLSASTPTGYPLGGYSRTDWTISTGPQEREQVGVPAGSFNAHKFVVTGKRLGPPGNYSAGNALAGRFAVTVWYAAEVKRYVMLRHQTWNMNGALLSDEVIELQEFRN